MAQLLLQCHLDLYLFLAFQPSGRSLRRFTHSQATGIEKVARRRLHKDHGDEMDSILKDTMNELHKVASEGKADTATAMRVYEIVEQSVKRLQGFAKKVGGRI